MEPEVSVVIPAYNCEKTLKAAVDSALCQNVNMEIIIIDDCSPQNLEGVLSEYRNNPQIRILKNETNMGVAATRNRGVALSKGTFVAFLDSDDIWRPGKLEKQLLLMKNTGTVFCSTARELMKQDGTKTGKIIQTHEKVTYKKLLFGNDINCSSVVIRRETALEFPMEGDDIHEDYICWLKILKKYDCVYAINEPLLLYRMSENSKSGSKLHSAKLTYKVYKRMGFGHIRSLIYFAGYAVNGIRKYL